MKKSLFTYAVLVHTPKEDAKAITTYDTQVIIEPTTILGKNKDDVAFKVTRLIPPEHADNSDNIEIIIRPF